MNRNLAVTILVFATLFLLGAALSQRLAVAFGVSWPWLLDITVGVPGCILIFFPQLALKPAMIVLSWITPQHDEASLERALRDIQILAAFQLQDDPDLDGSRLFLAAHSTTEPHPLRRPRLALGFDKFTRLTSVEEEQRLQMLGAHLAPLLNDILAGKDLLRLHLASIRDHKTSLYRESWSLKTSFPIGRNFSIDDFPGHEILSVVAKYAGWTAAQVGSLPPMDHGGAHACLPG